MIFLKGLEQSFTIPTKGDPTLINFRGLSELVAFNRHLPHLMHNFSRSEIVISHHIWD